MTFLYETTIYLTVTTILLLIFKRIFKTKMSAKWHVYIWALLLIRFLVPSLPESNVSVFNSVPTYYNYVQMTTGEPYISDTGSMASADNDVGIKYDDIVMDIYIFGALVLFSYFAVIYAVNNHRLKKKPQDISSNAVLEECKEKIGIRRNVIVISGGDTPMLSGIIKPKIIMPDGYSQSEKRDIILHELCHLKNGDIFIIWLFVIILCINWFNPIMWYSFFTLRRDLEVYCDECVLKYCDSKKEYATLLVKTALSKNRFILGTTSLQNGEKEVERRIKYMAFFKKPGVIWTIIIALLAILVSVVCLTNATKPVYCNMSAETFSTYPQMIIGSHMADIDYADEEKIVFHFNSGLFVYNIKSGSITNSFDLSGLNTAINTVQKIPGDIDIIVSSDGSKAVIKSIGEGDNYLLNLKTGKAKITDKTDLKNSFSSFDETFVTVPDAKGWTSINCVVNDEKVIYLTCEEFTLGSLKLCTTEGVEEYVFGEEGIKTLPDRAEVTFNLNKSNRSEIEKLIEYIFGHKLSAKEKNNIEFYNYSGDVKIVFEDIPQNVTNTVYVYKENGEFLYKAPVSDHDEENMVRSFISHIDRFSKSKNSMLYTIAEMYLEAEFNRVYSPYYEILDLKLSSWNEHSEDEASFFYTMTHKNFDKDPDTVDYIIKAKGTDEYDVLKREYLEPKVGNYNFKVKLTDGILTLYHNQAPKGGEWKEVKIDDFIF